MEGWMVEGGALFDTADVRESNLDFGLLCLLVFVRDLCKLFCVLCNKSDGRFLTKTVKRCEAAESILNGLAEIEQFECSK